MSVSKKEAVLSKNAPAPIGPYSQAIRSGHLLFCSGQVALDAVTGLVSAQDVEGQTRKVMENMGAVLQAGGATFDEVVKTKPSRYWADFNSSITNRVTKKVTEWKIDQLIIQVSMTAD
jgi:enamine deaminase RidA (YjgF/YER057c/UK114 family)